jgi:Domain of unknown function (DUF5666)
MKKLIATIAGLAALAATAGPALATDSPSASTAATRQYEGTVTSIDRGARTFRLRDSERGTVSVRVTRSTRFERISGFSGLRTGMTRVEATVKRSNGRWVATLVERSGGGGDHGGHGGDDD